MKITLRPSRLKVFGANRHELWISMALILGISCLPSMHTDFQGALILSAGVLVALFCAINAMLDNDSMGVVEIYVAGIWLMLMLILTPITLYSPLRIGEFAHC